MSALDNEILDVEAKLADQKSLGTECECMERISGYYRNVRLWNNGKAAEEKERIAYKV